jgi:hypothetical protein
MDAKDGAANVSVSGAWEEIKQGLSGGDHKQQHRENQADSRASLRAAAAQLLHQAKATTEHCRTFEQAKWAGNFPTDELDSHRRGEDACQGKQHEPEDDPIEHHAHRRFPVYDGVHGSNTSGRSEEWFQLNLKPGHPESILGAVYFPHKQADT